jgi:hypothetical protein
MHELTATPKRAAKRSRVVSEVPIATTVPEHLADELRRITDRDCSTMASTARRLLARGVALEAAATAAVEVR